MPTYQVPYAPSQILVPNGRLVDLLRASGQDTSRLLENQGNIQAQMWGNVGNAIQSGVQNIVQQQTDPRLELERERVAELKRQQAGRGVLADAIKQNTSVDPDTGQIKPNHEAIANAVSAAGYPDQAEAWLKTSAGNAEALDKLRASTANHQKLQLETAGDLAFTSTTPQEFTAAIGLAAQHGLIDEQQATQFLQSADNTPNGWEAIRQRFLKFSPEYKKQQAELQKPTKVGEGEKIINLQTGETLAAGAPKPVVVSEGATAFDPATGAVLASGGPKALDEFQSFKQSYPKQLGVDSWDKLTPQQQTAALGVYAESKSDPAVRAAALAQKNIAGLLAQAQLNNMPTPEQAKSVADDLVHHRIAPEQLASLFSTRGREGLAFKLAVTSEAKKIDPAFNFEEASAEYNLTKSPGFQNTVRYMDSTMESMPQLLKNAQALSNGNVRSINQLINAGKNQVNNVDLKKFRTDAVLVGDEVAKILAGGGTGNATSDAKLKQGQDLLGTSDSPAAIAATIGEIQSLLGNRRRALTRGTYMEGSQAGQSNAQPIQVGGFSVVVRQ